MTLTIDVFNSGYLPVNGGPGWDPRSIATWPASTATLIAGDRDAIVVDALMTIDEGHQLASWIDEAGKNLLVGNHRQNRRHEPDHHHRRAQRSQCAR